MLSRTAQCIPKYTANAPSITATMYKYVPCFEWNLVTLPHAYTYVFSLTGCPVYM